MPGSIFPTINPATTSGTQLATLLNDFRDIVVSGFQRSPTRPPGLLAGGYWIDTSFEASPDFYWTFKIYDGTNDIEIFRINLDSASASFAGGENLFTLQRISDDANGPILRLRKNRISGGGAVLSGDGLGRTEWQSKDDAANEPFVATVRAIATENHTTTALGTALVIEATADGATTRAEVARFQNNRLGLGTTNPQARLHVFNGLGQLVEQVSDDDIGAQSKAVKKRIAGGGQVVANDIIEVKSFVGVDELGAEVTLAEIVTSTTETVDSTDGGAGLIQFFIKESGQPGLTEVFNADGQSLNVNTGFFAQAYTLGQSDEPTAASIVDLDANNAIVNFTGATATTLSGISSGSRSRVVVLHNNSSVDITVKHNDTLAAVNDRILLPKNKDVKVIPNSSIELFYSSDGNWRIKSGSGGGGAEPTVITDNTLTASDQITLPDEAIITVLVEGASSAVTLNTLPFGSTAPATNGTTVTLIGTSNTNTVALVENDAAKGVILNGSPIILTRFKSITLQYILELDRYIEISRS